MQSMQSMQLPQMVQSEPMQAPMQAPMQPSNTNNVVSVTKPNSPRANPQLYLHNENNFYQIVMSSCVLVAMAVALPLLMPTSTMKWLSVSIAFAAFSMLMQGIMSYKRNFDAFEKNEEEFINWNSSNMFLYSVGATCLIAAIVVVYELYWNASPAVESNAPEVKSKSALDTALEIESLSDASSVQ